MASPSVRFELGEYEWLAERHGVLFLGHTDLGMVEFLITSEALVEFINPDLEGIDSDTAIETYVEFESDIHRIARREFVSRLGGEPPVLLTAADVSP
ncbi:DUF1488 family protein [Sphingomonas sp. OK281]|uniref:DUF1488 family protein n=1 Tax=Sphingomonas sp. OK281 TaxID=1881067 RepID=UPI0008E0F5E7|nr:DUF1488 family protein [Sphingomonas sp. OK281]SFO30731.1 Protein of unknown function [Sphingomonas sp. OK281]